MRKSPEAIKSFVVGSNPTPLPSSTSMEASYSLPSPPARLLGNMGFIQLDLNQGAARINKS